MIIRLSRADFSANNIGKYEFPKELSQFTLNAIAASGKVMTDEQKYALENFFSSVGAIENNGIWAKLDKVYIPFIGADVTKGLINYKDNNLDNTLNSNNLTLVNGGVKVKGETNVTAADAGNAVDGYVWNWDSKSVFMLNTESLIIDGSEKSIIQLSTYTGNVSNKWQGFNIRNTATNVITFKIDQSNNNLIEDTNGYSYIENSKIVTRPQLIGASSNGSNVICMLGDGITKTFAVANQYQADSNPHTLYPFALNIRGEIGAKSKACGALILGDYLTEEEMKSLQSDVETLYSKFVE